MKPTFEQVQAEIFDKVFFYHGQTTICVIQSEIGFNVVGESHCYDMDEYDKEVGKQSAYEDALNKLYNHRCYTHKTLDHLAKQYVNEFNK